MTIVVPAGSSGRLRGNVSAGSSSLTSSWPSVEHRDVRYTLVLLAAACAQAGCSFIFVEGPPDRHEQMPYFACSTSKAPPVLDTVAGGLYAASAAIPSNKTTETARIGAAVLAAGLAASAIYGFTQVGQCDEAYAALAARMYVPNPAPPPSQPVLPPPVPASFPSPPALPAPAPTPVPQP